MSRQTKGLKRETLDKFYTKKCVAEKCIENLKNKYYNISFYFLKKYKKLNI